jgi:2-polyprenyl-6-methoxyphenol hydroxylase-like FAD-dependent oxidoreductase
LLNEEHMSRKGHIEIAGAGLAGLTVAAALAGRGWSVRVHDPGRELCEIGAGIYLWVNALRALEAVDPYDEVVAGGERTNSPKLRDHRHGLLQREWLQGVGSSLSRAAPCMALS